MKISVKRRLALLDWATAQVMLLDNLSARDIGLAIIQDYRTLTKALERNDSSVPDMIELLKDRAQHGQQTRMEL